jgi:hypothetical protein
MTTLSEDRDYIHPKIVDVMIVSIRSALGKDSIVTTWGRGFSLSPDTLSHIDALEVGFRQAMQSAPVKERVA